MPCRSDNNYNNYSSNVHMQNEIDKLTQLLCYACGTLNHLKALDNTDAKLIEWFNKHHINDVKRVKDTMIKILKETPNTTTENMALILLAEARKIHPVSEYHVKWFHDLANEVVNEVVNKDNIDRQNLINRLTSEEKRLLGITK